MDPRPADVRAHASLGLLGDPFDVSRIETSDTAGIKVAIRAASLRLLATVSAMADEEPHRPIIVEKADVPAYYHVSALAQSLRAFALNDPVSDIVSLYVPIDMMRIGRVRAVLHTAAEWSASVGSDVALDAWIAHAFEDPDEELEEWSALQGFSEELKALRAALKDDPHGSADKLFGAPSVTREGSEDLEITMRVSVARVSRLETDPEEVSAVQTDDEVAADDPMSEAFTTTADEPDLSEEAPAFDRLASEYVIAYTRANLSPVVARGIEAYAAQGTAAMAEEMKISKAPTKTLAAILHYATLAKRAGAIFFDRFEMWENVPDELRGKIAATLTSLRDVLAADAGLVLMLPVGQVAEVEGSFAEATRAKWDFSELASVESPSAGFDPSVMRGWIASASLDGAAPGWCEPLLSSIPEGTSMAAAIAALGATISQAAEEGATAPDPAEMLRLLADGVEVG